MSCRFSWVAFVLYRPFVERVIGKSGGRKPKTPQNTDTLHIAESKAHLDDFCRYLYFRPELKARIERDATARMAYYSGSGRLQLTGQCLVPPLLLFGFYHILRWVISGFKA